MKEKMGFPYNKLDTDQKQIRLLSIIPDTNTDAIVRCTIQSVSLRGQQPKYEALSYVWGDPNATESVLVEGYRFPVTHNLFAALRMLRRPKQPRTIWVDYICINQTDTDEKNTQVAMMGDIYREARKVIALLADKSLQYMGKPVSLDLLQIGVTWTMRYVGKKFNRQTMYWWKLDITSRFSTRARRKKEISLVRASSGILDLVKLPYWNRMWTYQEYQVATQDPTCICGNVAFKMSLIDPERIKQLHVVADEIKRRNVPSAEQDKETRAHCQQVQETTMSINGSDDDIRGILSSPQDYQRQDLTRVPFAWSLVLTNHRQCSDPRDKIYGCYSFSPQVQKVYPPDYRKPAEQVFLETTEYLVNRERMGTMYHFLSLRGDHLTGSLPSWLPDYTKLSYRMIQSQTIPWEIHDDLWDPVKGCLPRVSHDLSTLHLWVRKAGYCTAVFKFGSDLETVASQIIDAITDERHVLWIEAWEPGSVHRRFIDACIFNTNRYGDFKTEEILEALHQVARGFRPERDTRQRLCSDMLRNQLPVNYGKLVLQVQDSWGRAFAIRQLATATGGIITGV
ncbi:HET-domain-containing protein [Aspergillus campestris IBT 28561]|uniref:HET-domain-containing protein n=1 Tax=Aspergillus campestris (strain IBT 28561) TaxID=1392248 RepID=A0A2I1CSS9_ASPC2|nr:HET-domain-containing protein [Aspergillus campestris IBT 28561]PKY00679.1 HET-domain-containing protein [Aspergillus campestris IBT 28561]